MLHSTLPAPLDHAPVADAARRKKRWPVVLAIVLVIASIATGCLLGWDLPDANRLMRSGR